MEAGQAGERTPRSVRPSEQRNSGSAGQGLKAAVWGPRVSPSLHREGQGPGLRWFSNQLAQDFSGLAAPEPGRDGNDGSVAASHPQQGPQAVPTSDRGSARGPTSSGRQGLLLLPLRSRVVAVTQADRIRAPAAPCTGHGSEREVQVRIRTFFSTPLSKDLQTSPPEHSMDQQSPWLSPAARDARGGCLGRGALSLRLRTRAA